MLAYYVLPSRVYQRCYTIVCQCTNLHQVVIVGLRLRRIRRGTPALVERLCMTEHT